MTETPRWITPPQLGKIVCTYVGRSDLDGEHTVQFEVNGRSYISFVLTEVVDTEEKLMNVSVVGSLSDGSYLIDLPSDTLTSGTRLKVKKGAPELIYAPQ